MQYSKNILFTGAGFTKNFGGLLAREMWSKIFNHQRIQALPRLTNLLKGDLDYESIYHKVIMGKYNDEEQSAISNAIYDVYQIIDEIVREWNFTPGSPNPVNIYKVNELIARFSGQAADKAGFFFTLNQDLFIERHFNSVMDGLYTPGIRRLPDAVKSSFQTALGQTDFITLPSNDELKVDKNLRIPRTIFYIKLHGSWGWRSATGNNAYVIGKDKNEAITTEPLLFWYFNLFKEVLSVQDSRMLIIGYGFGDKHINDVFVNSITHSGLRLFIISPLEYDKFTEQLKGKENGDKILDSLSGYFPYRLLDIFPQDQSDTHARREIINRFFNDN